MRKDGFMKKINQIIRIEKKWKQKNQVYLKTIKFIVKEIKKTKNIQEGTYKGMIRKEKMMPRNKNQKKEKSDNSTEYWSIEAPLLITNISL